MHPNIAQACPWTRLPCTPVACELSLWLQHFDLVPRDDRQACHSCHVLLQAIVASEAWTGTTAALVDLLGAQALANIEIPAAKVLHLITVALDFQFDCQVKLDMTPTAVVCDHQAHYPEYR
jgi:hypothetical protein